MADSLTILLLLISGQAQQEQPCCVHRHTGVWDAPPKHCPTEMMFDAPIVGNGDIGMMFCGNPDKTTFYLASNQFWNSNSKVDAPPSYAQRPGGAESYTQVRIGDMKMIVPALAANVVRKNQDDSSTATSYQAMQDLYSATINQTSQNGACQLSHNSFVASEDNLVVTNITVKGTCGNATFELSSGGTWNRGPTLPSDSGITESQILWITRDSVTDTVNNIVAAHCYTAGQSFTSQRWIITNTSGTATVMLEDGRCMQIQTNSTLHNAGNYTRISITDASACSSQNSWTLVSVSAPKASVPGYDYLAGYVGGQPETKDYHCKSVDTCVQELATLCNSTSTCGSFAIYYKASQAAQLYDFNKTSGAYLDTGWNMWRKDGAPGPPAPKKEPTFVLMHTATKQCAGLDSSGSFLVVRDCGDNATDPSMVWSYNATSKHLYTDSDTWGTGTCITAVEPNPLVKSAIASSISSSINGGVPLIINTSTGTDPDSSAMEVTLRDGEVLTIVSAVVTAGDCRGCSNTDDVKGLALSLLHTRGTNPEVRYMEHQAWWHQYWLSGAQIDLGPDYSLLEGFYYGMHYQIGSASRAGKTAPGLWGPWASSETMGWSGDYTLNYNFEANFYGVFSDNRVELAEPYFQTILNHVDLGKWRASMPFWGSGESAATPGFWAQDFNLMNQLSTDGTGYIPAGYKGIQLPTHLSPWPHFYFVSDWGQKNIGSFVSKAFMDQYEFTGNVTFLREFTYPLVKLNGEFYMSYMTRENGLSRPNPHDLHYVRYYNVMHSCAMEGCGAQGPNTAKNIQVSNNPPFDLGFVHRIFRALLEYSEVLGVDADQRAGWTDILHNIAPYPLTRTEDGFVVFAQATLNPSALANQTDGFPNASKCILGKDTSECGNARYPITFFNAMHPGEDVDLASDSVTLEIARATVDHVNALNDYSPTNGLCMAWPPSARVVKETPTLLDSFTKALNDTMMNNFIPFIDNRPTGGSGCNIENAGATVAINDLLVSVHGHYPNATVRFFPGGWKNTAVSFKNIRIKGAFLVSGSATGAAVNTFTVKSLVGNDFVFLWTFNGNVAPFVASNSVPITVTHLGTNRYSFKTTTGSNYTISKSA